MDTKMSFPTPLQMKALGRDDIGVLQLPSLLQGCSKSHLFEGGLYLMTQQCGNTKVWSFILKTTQDNSEGSCQLQCPVGLTMAIIKPAYSPTLPPPVPTSPGSHQRNCCMAVPSGSSTLPRCQRDRLHHVFPVSVLNPLSWGNLQDGRPSIPAALLTLFIMLCLLPPPQYPEVQL